VCFFLGTRGATSAEYFLEAGYAVIFMHRQFSLQPFSRHYSHSTNPFLDFLEIEPTAPTDDATENTCNAQREIKHAVKDQNNTPRISQQTTGPPQSPHGLQTRACARPSTHSHVCNHKRLSLATESPQPRARHSETKVHVLSRRGCGRLFLAKTKAGAFVFPLFFPFYCFLETRIKIHSDAFF